MNTKQNLLKQMYLTKNEDLSPKKNKNRNNVIIGILKGKYGESDEPDWFNDDINKQFENNDTNRE